MSDRRVNKDIQNFDSRDFLDQLAAYTYNYIEPQLDGEERQAGIMAQDLEATELGEQFVEEVEGVKYIDYDSMQSLMMACIVDLNKRLGELENALRK